MAVPWWGLPAFLFVSGLTLIIIAIIVPFQIEADIDDTLAGEFLFETDSGEGFDKWVTNEKPGSSLGWVEAYLFNVTNPYEVQMGGALPVVEEIGPYYYRQYLRNVNVTFDYINGERVVTSTPYIYLVFDESKSGNLRQDAEITMPGLGWWAIFKNPNVGDNEKGILTNFFAQGNGGTPFETHTVLEWLFGYDDASLSVVKLINPSTNPRLALLRNQTSPEDAYDQVNTSTVSCGYPNPGRFQQMIKWRGYETVSYWTPPLEVSGSPGNFFGFKRSGQEETEIHFWSLIGRNVQLYHSATQYYGGVKTYRYRMSPFVMQNSTNHPPNAQFYQFKFNGMFNLTTIYNAPIFFSKSHFLDADPELANYIVGMKPATVADDTYIDVEPLTGAAFVTYKRLQSNIQIGNYTNLVLQCNMSFEYIHPLVIIEVNSELDDQQISDLKDALDFYDRALIAEEVVLYGGSIVGCLLFIAGIWVAHHRREEQRYQHTLLDEEVDLAYGATKQ